MKVISVIYNEKRNAGPKAPGDIDKILNNKYNAKIIRIRRVKRYRLKLIILFFSLMFSHDVIILQHPLLLRSIFYKLLPKKRTVIIIHDISGLRNGNKKILNEEIKIFNSFHYIIVHNDIMKKYLISRGIDKDKLYTLEIFDYLANSQIKEKYTINKKKLNVVYPGNLKKEKSPFIYQIDSKKIDFILNLYGIGIESDIAQNIKYMGSFEPENINVINGDIGLIWDGNFDESDQSELFKNYTRFNNPHKLSCCMALGIPVIVWSKSAISEFVKKYNVGYLINNIYDINDLNLSDYDVKRLNSIKIGKKLRKGTFTLNVMEKILNDMK